MLERGRLLASLMELTGRSAARTRPELVERFLRHAIELTDADGALVALSAGRLFERTSMRRGATESEPCGSPGAPGEIERTLLMAGTPRALGDLADAARGSGELVCPGVEAGPVLFVPMRMREQDLGYVAVHRVRGAARFAMRDARSLALLSGWACAMADNLRIAESLEKLAVTDDLTQVYNYRYLKTALRREIKRATRFRQPLSLLMLDVDNLKGYNDRNGHLRGSHLLKEIAQIFASQVRSWDLVAKYGGDEFTVILPQTERPGALVVAERLRVAVERHAFPLAPPGSITVSAGIACYPSDGDTVASLIECADRALYRAKRAGRNRVEGWDPMAA